MSADRINSQATIVLKKDKLENNSRSGNRYTRVWAGSLTKMLAQRFVELFSGASHVELESTEDGNYQLTAEYPYDVINGSNSEVPVNSHELDESFEQVSVWNSDVMLATLALNFASYAAAIAAKAFLNGAVNNFQSTAMDAAAITEAEAKFSAVYSSGQLAVMLNLFRGIAYHGQTSCNQTKIVYNRRITAASFEQIQASFTGSGQIWTTAEVVAQENTPSLWWFNLPTQLLWFKSNPKVLTASNQKTEVIFSYTSCVAAWSGNNTAYNSATLLSF
jgi:hypothetical protein